MNEENTDPKPIRPAIPGRLKKALDLATALTAETLAEFVTVAVMTRLILESSAPGAESLDLELKRFEKWATTSTSRPRRRTDEPDAD